MVAVAPVVAFDLEGGRSSLTEIRSRAKQSLVNVGQSANAAKHRIVVSQFRLVR